jgi:hypothetical protein
MSFFRFLIFGIIFYLLYKILRRLLIGAAKQPEVRGQSESKSKLDLSNHDVEDIDYKDLKE